MAKYRFDHVHVIAPEPMKASEFYENVLHAKRLVVGTSPDGGVVVELDLEGTLMKIRGPRAKPLLHNSPLTGIEHFGLQTDNIEEAVAELKSRGVQFLWEVKKSSPGVKSTFFVAPEGVLIELIEDSKTLR
jgi:catechol 2,3-dioxygenase-like lactoylglutathione lyase family enzyme